MIFPLLALGCDREGGGKDPEGTETTLSSLPPLASPCERQPCVADVADASWEAPDSIAQAGYSVAATETHVIVGAPFLNFFYPSDLPQVQLLSLPDLSWQGAWIGEFDDAAGLAVAAGDIDGDGVSEVAFSRPRAFTSTEGGRVQIVAAPIEGEQPMDRVREEDSPPGLLLTVVGDDEIQLGFHMFFSADGSELVVNGAHKDTSNGRVLSFSTAPHPEGRTVLYEEDALRSLRAPDSLGAIERWDGDHDGQDDLVVQHYQETALAWFQGPWNHSTTEDFDARWLGTCVEECDFGGEIADVGDVTGDGAPDLVFADTLDARPEVRAGRAYVLEAAGTGGHADDLPLQVHGTDIGEGMGWALEGADIDGDGQQDLVISASGVSPGRQQGALLGFRGPVRPGTLTAADADGRVYGEHAYDYFTRAIAVVDADGDERQDLVAGASGFPEGELRGAVYLLTGATLLP